jgi:hypothetical protein
MLGSLASVMTNWARRWSKPHAIGREVIGTEVLEGNSNGT